MVATRTEYLKQLDEIDALIRRLGDKAVSDIRALGLALEGDTGAAEGVRTGGKAERRLRAAIEENCLDVMLLQQPLVAGDLRQVTGSFRIVSDLTHIDEMARDVAELSQSIPSSAIALIADDLAQAVATVSSMVERALAAFHDADEAGARTVFAMDDQVDRLYAQAADAIVAKLRADTASISFFPELLMVAKYFERMGDDAEHIADWAIFRVTGTHTADHRER